MQIKQGWQQNVCQQKEVVKHAVNYCFYKYLNHLKSFFLACFSVPKDTEIQNGCRSYAVGVFFTNSYLCYAEFEGEEHLQKRKIFSKITVAITFIVTFTTYSVGLIKTSGFHPENVGYNPIQKK